MTQIKTCKKCKDIFLRRGDICPACEVKEWAEARFEAKNTRPSKKPSLDEVKQYCIERENNVDSNLWYNFYESKGWMIGKNKMKDWRAAVRTWEKKDDTTTRTSDIKYQQTQRYLKNMEDKWKEDTHE